MIHTHTHTYTYTYTYTYGFINGCMIAGLFREAMHGDADLLSAGWPGRAGRRVPRVQSCQSAARGPERI